MVECLNHGVVWKGSDSEITLYIHPSLEEVTNISVDLATVGDNCIHYDESQIIMTAGIGLLHLQAVQIGELEDGVIRYIIQYDSNGKHIVKDGNTKYVLKTPCPYTPINYITEDECRSIVELSLDNYYTKAEIDEKIGEINNVLEAILG